MENLLQSLNHELQKLIGLHRQLFEVVRREREALIAADLKLIQETLYTKEALIQTIKQSDGERARIVAQIEFAMNRAPESLTVSQIVLTVQGEYTQLSEQLRSSSKTLVSLIERISDQNTDNRGMVERSLEHLKTMKSNLVREEGVKAETYTAQGQRNIQSTGAKFISKEI